MIVGAESQHHRGLGHHGLIEVCRSQFFFLGFRTGHHYAVELQVAHRLGALGLLQQVIEQLIANGAIGIFANAFTYHCLKNLIGDVFDLNSI